MPDLRVKILLFLLLPACLNAQQNAPSLTNVNGKAQLLVNNKPFIILGGELGNSSASSAAYMQLYWGKLQSMKLNSVLVPAYWELIEPQENKFDFSLIDSMILNARKHQLKIVFLWFGTWKNSMSCYVPSWIKKDAAKYERTIDSSGKSEEILSAFGSNTFAADKKAFEALMQHIKAIDAAAKTVIMMQVENEIGMLPTAREHTATANKLFSGNIPDELGLYLKINKEKLVPELKNLMDKQGFVTTGTWQQVFGNSIATDEIFQAWYYAKFTEGVTKAGKQIYNIPMYVNAALNRPGVLPGNYPSAGPLPQVMDIWKAAAPSLNMLSPDFYNPNTEHWCDLYTRQNNLLFIPEIHLEAADAAKAFFTIGHYNSIGFSPFSIENASENMAATMAKTYSVLNQLIPFITNGAIKKEGVLLSKKEQSKNIEMGDYTITVKHDNTLGWSEYAKDSIWTETGAIILQIGKDEFLIGGTGIVCTFKNKNGSLITNIDRVGEGQFVKGQWIAGRRLNGDEDHQGRHLRIPAYKYELQKISLYNTKDQ